jgi:hypothetical protein
VLSPNRFFFAFILVPMNLRWSWFGWQRRADRNFASL